MVLVAASWLRVRQARHYSATSVLLAASAGCSTSRTDSSLAGGG